MNSLCLDPAMVLATAPAAHPKMRAVVVPFQLVAVAVSTTQVQDLTARSTITLAQMPTRKLTPYLYYTLH
jgi:hypothetical protein